MERETSQPQDPASRAYDKRLEREPEAGRFSEPRSWWDRTADEVAAWFGDVGALRRRQRDGAVGDHAGQGPAADADADARIVALISRQMTEDAQLDASRIKVACHDAAVTLSGEVSTEADARHAEHLALAAPGVLGVRNQLVVA